MRIFTAKDIKTYPLQAVFILCTHPFFTTMIHTKTYHTLLEKVYSHGTTKADRTCTGTYSLFGEQIRFNLADGFPLITSKRVHWPSVVHELLWFLKGSTNVEYLKAKGVRIWNEWADADGELGPIYGKQWRNFGGIDQIRGLEANLKSNPDSRRLIVSAWNVGELAQMALPPCHAFWQCYVADGKLSLHLYQRSADVFLGVPFNIASYALLLTMLARVAKLRLGELIISFGDVHLYHNHLEQARTQLAREIPTQTPTLMLLRGPVSILDYDADDIALLDYKPLSAIKAKVCI